MWNCYEALFRHRHRQCWQFHLVLSGSRCWVGFQLHHVHHRLQRYGSGRRMDYAQADPDDIAQAMVEEIARPAAFRDVETDGAARAAAMLAELL